MHVDLVPLASTSQIERTPSGVDGIPADLEEDLRAFGCKLIHEAGILLKQYVFIPQCNVCSQSIMEHLDRKQVAVATAQILFQRFWYVTSMKQFGIGVSPLLLIPPTTDHPCSSHRTSEWEPYTLHPNLKNVRSGCATLSTSTTFFSNAHPTPSPRPKTKTHSNTHRCLTLATPSMISKMH